MSNQAINKFNQGLQSQSQVNFLQNTPPVMQGQNTGADVVQQTGGGGYLNRAKASQDANPLTTLGLSAGIGYGLGQAMDSFGPKCRGEYDKTVLGRLGAWGDKVSRDTKFGRFIERVFGKKTRFMDAWADKSRLGYALKNHSTRPDWKMAKMSYYGLEGFLDADTSNVLENFMKPITEKCNLGKFEQYGMSADEIKNFAQTLVGKTPEQYKEAIRLKELEMLGATRSQITSGYFTNDLDKLIKELKAKKLGFDSFEHYEKLAKNIMEHKEEFMQALEKGIRNNGDQVVSINRFVGGPVAKLKSHLGGRTVSMSEILNKFKAASGKGNATVLGRMLPKSLGYLLEGCTNRFAGGKLAPFMQAFIFADMLYHTYTAPKGEKIKTMAERFVNDFTYFIGGILGLVGLHKIGGLKYIGTNAAGREAYRAALTAHNAKNAAKGFANKKLFDESAKAVDSLLNTKGLKWYEKALQKVGRFVNMGNEHFKPYLSPNGANMNLFRRIMNTNIIGVPFRIWAVMFAFTPLIVKATTKFTHLIFGRPTHSVLDEEEEVQDPEQAAQSMVNPNQNPQAVPAADANNTPNTNLINQTINNQAVNNQTMQNQVGQNQALQPQNANGQMVNNGAPQNNSVNQAQTMNSQNQSVSQTTTATQTQTVNNSNQNNGNTQQEPVRTYIPSAAPVQIGGPDTTPADQAMAHADKAEKQIQSVLAGLYK